MSGHYAKQWQLYGKLPAFYCRECHNAVDASKCPVCSYRITDVERERIIKVADLELERKITIEDIPY